MPPPRWGGRGLTEKKRMYRRICDCFNRPICSAPGAWTDVLIRSSTDGNETLKLTGEKRRCLNLG